MQPEIKDALPHFGSRSDQKSWLALVAAQHVCIPVYVHAYVHAHGADLDHSLSTPLSNFLSRALL